MPINKFIKQFFTKEPEGIIYRQNIIAGLRLRMHGVDAVKKTMHAIDSSYQRRVCGDDIRHPPTLDDLKALVVEAIGDACSSKEDRPAPYFGQDFFDTGNQRFATIISIDILRRYLLSDTAVSKIYSDTGVDLPMDKGGGLTRRQWQRLVDEGPWEFDLRAGTQLGFPLLWFTMEEEVARVRAAGATDKFANRLRDAVGLAHHQASTGLFLITFLGKALADNGHYRPIFLDAKGHKRFKLRHSVDDKGEPRRWGHTADLEQLEETEAIDASVDGVVERVVKPLMHNAFKYGKLRFEAIGVTTTTRAADLYTHHDFIARLVHYNRRPPLPGSVSC